MMAYFLPRSIDNQKVIHIKQKDNSAKQE